MFKVTASCLICNVKVPVLQEHNLKRHDSTQHVEPCVKCQGEERREEKQVVQLQTVCCRNESLPLGENSLAHWGPELLFYRYFMLTVKLNASKDWGALSTKNVLFESEWSPLVQTRKWASFFLFVRVMHHLISLSSVSSPSRPWKYHLFPSCLIQGALVKALSKLQQDICWWSLIPREVSLSYQP